MKNFILLIVLFVSLSSLEAQNRSRKRGNESLTDGKQLMQISGGYHISFINPQGLNYALEQANQNSFNTQQFSKFGMMQGYSAALTWYGKYEDCKHRKMTSYLFEIAYNGGKQTIEGKSNSINVGFLDNQTNLRLNMHNLSLKYGFMPSLGMVDIGLGAGINAGISSTYKDVNNSGAVQIDNNINYGLMVFMPIYITFGKSSLISLGIRPYYQYQLNVNNAQNLYNAINSTPIPVDQVKKLDYQLNNYGVDFHVCFLLSKLNYH